MDWTLIALVVVLFLAVAAFKVLGAGSKASTSTYRKLDALLTPAERSFFGVLDSVVGDQMQIFAKVRVADVIAPAKGLPSSDRQRAFNRISAKHFDFVLCNTADLSVVCALELDDKSHESKRRKARDDLLRDACDSAELPLVRFKAKSGYARSDIEVALADYMPRLASSPVAATTVQGVETEQIGEQSDKIGSIPDRCPKCGSELVKRVAKKGKHEGKEFMACSSFPKCRYVLS